MQGCISRVALGAPAFVIMPCVPVRGLFRVRCVYICCGSICCGSARNASVSYRFNLSVVSSLVVSPHADRLRIELDLRDHTSLLRDEYLPRLASDFAGVSAEVRDRLTVLHEKPLCL